MKDELFEMMKAPSLKEAAGPSLKEETGLSLATLDERELQLTSLVSEFKGLSISGISDRDGYRQVDEARKHLKGVRVQLEKDAKALRDNAIQFQRKVIAREKELVAIIEPEELRLKAETDRIDAEKEAIRKEKERQEAAKVQERLNALAQYNYAADFYELKIMDEDKFKALLIQAESDFNKEQERKADEENKRRAEEEKLRAERAELDRLRAEQEAKEKAIREEQERKEAAFREEQEKARKLQAEQEAKLRAEREAIEAEKRKIEEEKRVEQAKKEAAERARIEEQERAKREEAARLEKERLAKIEAERQEALRPDKEKLSSFAASLLKITPPGVTSKEASKVLREAAIMLEKASLYIMDQSKKL